MKMPSFGGWVVMVLLAASAWLWPLLWSLQRQRGLRPPPATGALLPVPSMLREVRPLILYVAAWPTRATLNLREIQGLTTESESTLAPAQVADNLYSDLGRLGITPEIHRIDRLPETTDLATFRPIVIVQPARHGRPPAAVGKFFELQVEAFVARHAGRQRLVFTDVTVSETPEDGGVVQGALQAITRYYGCSYLPGPTLGPTTSLFMERKLMMDHATTIQKELTR